MRLVPSPGWPSTSRRSTNRAASSIDPVLPLPRCRPMPAACRVCQNHPHNDQKPGGHPPSAGGVLASQPMFRVARRQVHARVLPQPVPPSSVRRVDVNDPGAGMRVHAAEPEAGNRAANCAGVEASLAPSVHRCLVRLVKTCRCESRRSALPAVAERPAPDQLLSAASRPSAGSRPRRITLPVARVDLIRRPPIGMSVRRPNPADSRHQRRFDFWRQGRIARQRCCRESLCGYPRRSSLPGHHLPKRGTPPHQSTMPAFDARYHSPSAPCFVESGPPFYECLAGLVRSYLTPAREVAGQVSSPGSSRWMPGHTRSVRRVVTGRRPRGAAVPCLSMNDCKCRAGVS